MTFEEFKTGQQVILDDKYEVTVISQTPLKITHQGAILVNGACIIEESNNIVLIEIDCRSKYIECISSFNSKDSVGITLVANESTLYIKEDTDRNEPTLIEFEDYKDFDVHSYNTGRYSISICLHKREQI